MRVRPTRLGLGFLALLAGVAVAAFNTGNNLLYAVLALMLAMLALQAVLAELNLRGVSVQRRLPTEVFAFEAAQGGLILVNQRRAFPAIALEVEEIERGEARAGFLLVPSGGQAEGPVTWTFPERGQVQMGRLRVSSAFPFGLFLRFRDLACPGELLVYPRRGGRGLPFNRAGRGSLEDDSARHPGGDGDFVGLRPYQPGDPMRSIHWPNSARSGTPMVVQRASGRAEQVVLKVTGRPGRLEQELAEACGQAVRHLQAGHVVGLELRDQAPIAPAQGASHRRRLLTALALVPPEDA